jgi:hypothetical protein
MTTLRASMLLSNNIKHIFEINNTLGPSETMAIQTRRAIRAGQPSVNKVIWIPVEPAVIVQHLRTWFGIAME